MNKCIGDMNIEELKDFIIELQEENSRYERRKEKAIEYLKDESIVYPTAKEWREHLIDILKGENNE